MARNGHKSETLRRESADRRAAVRRTAAALEDRLRFRGHQVSEAVEQARDTVERTRGKLHGVDNFVRRYRYPILGGALGLGVVLGIRRRRRPQQVASVEDAVRVVLERQRPSMFRSLFGAAAALAVRQGIALLSERMGGDDSEFTREPLPRTLPPGRPYAE